MNRFILNHLKSFFETIRIADCLFLRLSGSYIESVTDSKNYLGFCYLGLLYVGKIQHLNLIKKIIDRLY